MSFETYADRGSEPEGYSAELTFVGNAGASPTSAGHKFFRNMTVTWVSLGLYTVTFADPPGNFIGMHGYSFMDVTPGNAAGWTAVVKAYTAPTSTARATIQFSTYNSTFGLANIPTTMTFSCDLKFKRGQATL